MKNPKKTITTTIIVLTVLFCAFVFGVGVVGYFSRIHYKDRLLKEFAAHYPEDTFTNPQEMMKVSYPTITVESELYPDCTITVINKNGQLISNYPRYIHADGISDYYADIIDDYICADEITVLWTGSDTVSGMNFPLDEISDEEFISEHVHGFNVVIHLYYDNEYPSEDEMEAMIRDLMSGVDTKCRFTVMLHHTGDEAASVDPRAHADITYECTIDENDVGSITCSHYTIPLEDYDI